MKLASLTSLGISIVLLNSQILFAQNNGIPLNQSSVLVGQYSNIGDYAENRDEVSCSSNKSSLSERISTPIGQLQSSSSNLDFSPKLMMPPMEEGERAIEKLGIGEKGVSKINGPENLARVGSPLSSPSAALSSSHNQALITSVISSTEETALDGNEEAILYDRVSRSGLANGGNDCFINSSLQLLKALGLPFPATMPNLTRFLNNKVKPDEDCRALRLEMANEVMASTQEFDPQPNTEETNPNNVVKKIRKEGTAVLQQDAAAFLLCLLNKVEAPKITFTETLTNQEQTGTPRTAQREETLFPLTLPLSEEVVGGLTMQDVFDRSLTAEISMKWNDGDLDKTRVSQTRLFSNPAPEKLIVSIGRFRFDHIQQATTKRRNNIEGVLNTIKLPLINGEVAFYQPNAIICHLGDSANSGHYICYRKEENTWWKFDDSVVTEVVIDNGTEDNENIAKNCYVISYVRSNAQKSDSLRSNREAQISEPSKEHTEAAHIVNAPIAENQKIIKKDAKSKKPKKEAKDVSSAPLSSSSLAPLNAENTASSATKNKKQSISLTLEHFRTAVNNYSTAARFIIEENNTGKTLSIPLDQTLVNEFKINQQNKTIIRELLTTFSKLHPPEKVVISLISKLNLLKEYPSLSEAMMKKILNTFDEGGDIGKMIDDFRLQGIENYPSLSAGIMKEILEAFDKECSEIDQRISNALLKEKMEEIKAKIADVKNANKNFDKAKKKSEDINANIEWWFQRLERLYFKRADTNYLETYMKRIIDYAKDFDQHKGKINDELMKFIDQEGFKLDIELAIEKDSLLDIAKKDAKNNNAVFAEATETAKEAWALVAKQVQDQIKGQHECLLREQQQEQEEIKYTEQIYELYKKNKETLLIQLSTDQKAANTACDSCFNAIDEIWDDWRTSENDSSNVARIAFEKAYKQTQNVKRSFEEAAQGTQDCLKNRHSYVFLNESNRTNFFDRTSNVLSQQQKRVQELFDTLDATSDPGLTEKNKIKAELESLKEAMKALAAFQIAEKKLMDTVAMPFNTADKTPMNIWPSSAIYDSFANKILEASDTHTQATSAENNLHNNLKEVQNKYLNSLSHIFSTSVETVETVIKLKKLRSTIASLWKNAEEVALTNEQDWHKARNSTNAAKDAKITWADNIFRLAEKCTGSFFLGEATKKEGEILGNLWIGLGESSEIDEEGFYMSSDQLKRIRPFFYKVQSQNYQMNFERRSNTSQKWGECLTKKDESTWGNGHLTIINPHADDSKESSMSLKHIKLSEEELKHQTAYFEKEAELQKIAEDLYDKACKEQQKLFDMKIKPEVNFDNFDDGWDQQIQRYLFNTGSINRDMPSFHLKQNVIQKRKEFSVFNNDKEMADIEQNLVTNLWPKAIEAYKKGLHAAPESKKDFWKDHLNTAIFHLQLNNSVEESNSGNEKLWNEVMTTNQRNWKNFDKELTLCQKVYDLVSASERNTQKNSPLKDFWEKKLNTLKSKSRVIETKKSSLTALEKAKKAKTTNKHVSYAWYAVSSSLEKSCDSWIKLMEAEESEKTDLAAQYRSVAYKYASVGEFFEKAAKAHASGKTDEGDSWYNTGWNTGESARTMLKAMEAEESEKAAQYRSAADKYASVGEFYKKAAKAFAVGRTDEGKSWFDAGANTGESAEMMLKAMEAEESRKQDLAAQYRTAADKLTSEREFFEKAVKAFVAGRTDEGNSWYNAGVNAEASVKTMIKAMEAKESEKTDQYSSIANKYASAVQFFKKAAKVYATVRTDEGNSWYNAGLNIEESAKTMLKAIEAEESGKRDLVAQYSSAADKLTSVGEFYKKAAEAFAAWRIDKGKSWYNAGWNTRESAKTMIKAMEAKESEKTDQYSSIANKYASAVEFFEKAAKAHASGKTDEGNSWFNEGVSTYESAQTMLANIEVSELQAVEKELQEKRKIEIKNANIEMQKPNDLRKRATKVAETASASIEKAEKAPQTEASSLWNEAIQKAKEAQAAWAEAVEALRKSSDKVPDPLKAEWNKQLENGENEQAAWSSRIKWCEAKKIEVNAEMAKNKVSLEAEKESPEAHLITSLWDEAIQQARQAEVAFISAFEAFQNAQDTALERFRDWYIERLEATQKEKIIWTTKITELESLKNQALQKTKK